MNVETHINQEVRHLYAIALAARLTELGLADTDTYLSPICSGLADGLHSDVLDGSPYLVWSYQMFYAEFSA